MQNNPLLNPIRINHTVVKNRIVMPPMDTNFAEMDGTLSAKQYAYLLERARGGTGLIIVEATSVSWPYGKISERQLRLNDPAVSARWHDLTDSVHAFGTKILIQLHHGGFMAVPAYSGGRQSVSSSDFSGARAMTREEVLHCIMDFIEAAKIAVACGFDGVEIHAAHMYLINQFLSPISNHRDDEYGGTCENRFRFLREVLEGIRRECPEDFLLSVRLAALDHSSGGITLEEGTAFARMCEECGADMINVSCGFYESMSQTNEGQWEPEGPRLYMSEAVRKTVNIPVAIVGKMRSPEFCGSAIAEGKTDMVCIGRQLICDPEYPNKILFNKEARIRPCLNCSEGCIGQFYFQHGSVRCVANPYVGYEDLYTEYDPRPVARPKNIAVIGGGAAGMQFTITASARGHKVTLLEKTSRLGGQLIPAAGAPFKEELTSLRQWFLHELAASKATVMMETTATLELLRKLEVDAVVLAAGSDPFMPPIPGIEKTMEATSFLDSTLTVPSKQKVVIIGGGVVGAELAHLLCEAACAVTVLEMLPEICRGHEVQHKEKLEKYLAAHARIEVSAKVESIDDQGVVWKDRYGNINKLDADVVVNAAGRKSNGSDLANEIIALGIPCHAIGDAIRPTNLRFATRSALELAYAL